MNKKGLLVLNLGTPDSPEPPDVGRYLKEFLMDKWVIDIPFLLRWFLVKIMIVPRRKFAASTAYKTIWGKRGSPLAFHLEDLKRALISRMSDRFHVVSAMRYGNPGITKALQDLNGLAVDEIIIFSLYPQYAESTSRSSEEECRRLARKLGINAKLRFYPAFYDHPEFIAAYADILRPKITAMNPDHVLLSFHGLPERHMKAVDRSGGNHCLQSPDCCARIVDANRDCYRAQSFATARALARALLLEPTQYSVSFQSRLGRTPWIKPYTDLRLMEFPAQGVRALAVACPSFAADCLETVEEIADRGKTEFLKAGGQKFQALECPNSHPRWVEAVDRMVSQF